MNRAPLLLLLLAAATSFAAAPLAPAPAVSATNSSAQGNPPQATAFATTAVDASAAVTATCRDGSAFSGVSKKGACSGHKGVKAWTGPSTPVSAAVPTAPAQESAKAAAQRASAPLPAAAAGGGTGKVWVNEKSNTYHCQADRYYGRTKAGVYMTESEAKAKGAHADHGRACT